MNKNKFFVHIPKTAGRSCFQILSKLGHKYIDHWPTYLNEIIDVSKINVISKIKHKYPTICLDDCMIYTVVRNPYTRVISAYNYLLNTQYQNDLDASYKKILLTYPSFDDFIEDLPTIAYKIVHLLPQHYFVCVDDAIVVNKVCKFETIVDDMLSIDKKFINLTKNKPHSDTNMFDLSDRSKIIIQQVYAKDFELFGYMM